MEVANRRSLSTFDSGPVPERECSALQSFPNGGDVDALSSVFSEAQKGIEPFSPWEDRFIGAFLRGPGGWYGVRFVRFI